MIQGVSGLNKLQAAELLAKGRFGDTYFVTRRFFSKESRKVLGGNAQLATFPVGKAGEDAWHHTAKL